VSNTNPYVAMILKEFAVIAGAFMVAGVSAPEGHPVGRRKADVHRGIG
jgi:hypothetical protein